MQSNAIIEIAINGYNSETEFVTVNDVKRELNLLFDNPNALEFDDDDLLLTDIVRRARNIVEEYTGVGLTSKTITVVLRNELGGIELPLQPYTQLTAAPTIKDKDGNAITDYTLTGNWFKKLESPCYDYIEITYNCGYNKDTQGNGTPWLPDGLRDAWIAQAVHMYKNRGDENVGVCEKALNNCAPYIRPYKSVVV